MAKQYKTCMKLGWDGHLHTQKGQISGLLYLYDFKIKFKITVCTCYCVYFMNKIYLSNCMSR